MNFHRFNLGVLSIFHCRQHLRRRLIAVLGVVALVAQAWAQTSVSPAEGTWPPAQLQEGYYLIKSAYSGNTDSATLASQVLMTYRKSKSANYTDRRSSLSSTNQIPTSVTDLVYGGRPFLNVSAPTVTKGIDPNAPTADAIWYVKPLGDGTYSLLSTTAMAYVSKLLKEGTVATIDPSIVNDKVAVMEGMLAKGSVKNAIKDPSNQRYNISYPANPEVLEQFKQVVTAGNSDAIKQFLMENTNDAWTILYNFLMSNTNGAKNARQYAVSPIIENYNSLFAGVADALFPLLSPVATGGKIVALSDGQYGIQFGDLWAMAKDKGAYTKKVKGTTDDAYKKDIEDYNSGALYSGGSVSVLDYEDNTDLSSKRSSLLSGATETPVANSQGAWSFVRIDDNNLPQTLTMGQEIIKRNFLKSEDRIFGYTARALSRLKTTTTLKAFVEEILNLRAHQDDYRVKWDETTVNDNLFRVVNTGWDFFSDTKRFLTASYFDEKFGTKYTDYKDTVSVKKYDLYHTLADPTAVSQIFKIVKSGDGTCTLTNPNIKSGINTTAVTGLSDKDSKVKLTTDASQVKVEEWDPYFFPGVVTISFPGLPMGQNMIHTNNHPFESPGAGSRTNARNNYLDTYPNNILVAYSGYSSTDGVYATGSKPHEIYKYVPTDDKNPSAYADYMSAWYLEPAKTIDLPVKHYKGASDSPSDYKHIYSSFNYPFAVEIPNGVDRDASGRQWIYTERHESTADEFPTYIVVRPMGNAIVDKEVPIVVETKNFETITLKIVKDAEVPSDAVKYKSVVWKGALEPVEVIAGSYAILNHPARQGFFTTTKTGYMAPNRVYLDKGNVVSGSSKFIGINSVFSDNPTTGIEQIEQENSASEVLYDLQGRRVNKVSRGIFVNAKGGKVVVR